MWEVANGRPGGARERRSEQLRVPPQALHPWSEQMGRGEPSLQRSLAVALTKAHGVPAPGTERKVTAAQTEPATGRPRSGLLSAGSSVRPTPAALWVHFEVGVRGDFSPLSGRCYSSAGLNPELEIPVDRILFLFTWLRALSLFKLRVVLEAASRHMLICIAAQF